MGDEPPEGAEGRAPLLGEGHLEKVHLLHRGPCGCLGVYQGCPQLFEVEWPSLSFGAPLPLESVDPASWHLPCWCFDALLFAARSVAASAAAA